MTKKFTFEKMNDFTYRFYQWPPVNERDDLLDLIMTTAPYTENIAKNLCNSDCYRITALQNVLFNGKSKHNIAVLSRYVYEKKFYVWSPKYKNSPGSYQMVSTKTVYEALAEAELIDSNYKYTDCDYGTKPEQRQKCFDELIAQMCAKNISWRVCFDNGSAHGHAIMVCNDDKGRPVVIDNSSRPHEWPGNDMYEYIKPSNIKWWTCIE